MAKPQTWTVEIEARCPCCGEDVVFNATGCAGVQGEDGVSFTSATPEGDLPSKRELELEARARAAEEEKDRAARWRSAALELARRVQNDQPRAKEIAAHVLHMEASAPLSWACGLDLKRRK